MSFHIWLQNTIRDSGMSRGDVAKAAGIPKTQLDALWIGHVGPSNYQMSRLCKVLQTDEMEVLRLINGKHEPNLQPIVQRPVFDSSMKTAAGGSQLKNTHKTPLKPINGRTCVITGKPNPERAHYTGQAQFILGKGLSEKCDNLFVAEIDRELHQKFDQPESRKSLEASHDFLVAILLTIKRKVELGLIEIKG